MAARKGRRECARNRRTFIMSPRFAILARRARRERPCRIAIHLLADTGSRTLSGAIITIFVIAYAAIALEHPLRINKSATALVGAGLLWTVYAVLSGDPALIDKQLNESVASTAQIVFFLIGAMTIVEVIDAHNGFEVITSLIRTRKQATLMWLVGFVTFFLSAILDNLTTTIVMISLMKKLLANQNDRLFFASMIVIAANAGGAWSAIRDVTTTMLWIGGGHNPPCPTQGGFFGPLVQP